MDTETTYKPCYHSVLPAPCGGEPYAHLSMCRLVTEANRCAFDITEGYAFCAQLPKGNSESTNLCLAPTDSSLEAAP